MKYPKANLTIIVQILLSISQVCIVTMTTSLAIDYLVQFMCVALLRVEWTLAKLLYRNI